MQPIIDGRNNPKSHRQNSCRVIAEPVYDSEKNIVFEQGTLIDEDAISKIEQLNLSQLRVRSPMT